MLVSDIITSVRDTLNDNGTRWEDDKLIRLIDEAQKNICRRTKALRSQVNLVANPGQSSYTLPSNVQLVSRVLYNGDVLKIVSHEQMDDIKRTWATDTGTPKYVITNKMERGIIKLSPIPDFVENDPFDLSKAQLIGLYFIKKPDTLTATTSELELEDQYDYMIKRYVVGNAWRQDLDAQNKQAGNEELAIYEAEIKEIEEEVAKSFVSNNTVYETQYWTGL